MTAPHRNPGPHRLLKEVVGGRAFHARVRAARSRRPSFLSAGASLLVGGLIAAGAAGLATTAWKPPDTALAASKKGKRKPARVDKVRKAVVEAQLRGQISAVEGRSYRGTWHRARRLHGKLRGIRRRELGYVISTMRSLAARGRLTASRMPALFLTLRRNHFWWNERPLPRAGSRLTFEGSRVIFQYYPGRGLQIQPLANFGKANGYWGKRNPNSDVALAELLDELIALRADRGGFPAWEYYFQFGTGGPPWVSAIAQGTAIQALARAGARLDRPHYLSIARGALGAFGTRTPRGVRVPLARDGNWYALYSFAPGLRVLNAHAQAVNGLYDLWAHGSSSEARALYQEGQRALRRRISGFDTGAWSKYATPGREASANYHRLNRDIVRGTCRRSKQEGICKRSSSFSRYLNEAPRITSPRVGRPLPNRPTSIRFFLSKVSDVSVFVKREGSKRVVRDAYGRRYRGVRGLAIRAPSRPGTYRVDVVARDLVGNRGERNLTLEVRKPKKKAKKKAKGKKAEAGER